MFESKIEKNIKEGEEVIRIVRKYPLVFWWPIFWGVVLIIAPFFFLVPLWQWGAWGIGVFFASLALGMYIGLRVVVVYSLNVFIITSERIIDIDQTGFFSRTVSETTYDKIQDVSYTIKGLTQTMFHFGGVVIQTAGQVSNLELSSVKNPEEIQQMIIRVKQNIS